MWAWGQREEPLKLFFLSLNFTHFRLSDFKTKARIHLRSRKPWSQACCLAVVSRMGVFSFGDFRLYSVELLLAADFNNWIPAFRLQNTWEVDTLFSFDASALGARLAVVCVSHPAGQREHFLSEFLSFWIWGFINMFDTWLNFRKLQIKNSKTNFVHFKSENEQRIYLFTYLS